jgi:hypothetical protein
MRVIAKWRMTSVDSFVPRFNSGARTAKPISESGTLTLSVRCIRVHRRIM